MKLKPYQKYKDSRIQWIGEIPEGWNVNKIKHFSISIAGGTPDTTNTAFWDGDVPWLPSGMVHDKTIFENEITKAPILMLTTECSEELKTQAKGYGVKGWLVKPVNMDLILKGIDHVYNKYKQVS